MDLNMPVMNGFEATKIIKRKITEEIYPKIAIVAATANDHS